LTIFWNVGYSLQCCWSVSFIPAIRFLSNWEVCDFLFDGTSFEKFYQFIIFIPLFIHLFIFGSIWLIDKALFNVHMLGFLYLVFLLWRFLKGASSIDQHMHSESFERNIPVRANLCFCSLGFLCFSRSTTHIIPNLSHLFYCNLVPRK